ncbi:hypothetical protein DFH09DRAFT_1086319 [Mycena vulgaris]|nr:hypothetical protein DFH09DRAFT_1086319 [Mycena vulgaris]
MSTGRRFSVAYRSAFRFCILERQHYCRCANEQAVNRYIAHAPECSAAWNSEFTTRAPAAAAVTATSMMEFEHGVEAKSPEPAFIFWVVENLRLPVIEKGLSELPTTFSLGKTATVSDDIPSNFPRSLTNSSNTSARFVMVDDTTLQRAGRVKSNKEGMGCKVKRVVYWRR